MAKYYYPAIFEPAEDIQGYVVTVPDIEGCFTQGKNLTDATKQTIDAIGTMLDDVAEKDFPKPSNVGEIDLSHCKKGTILNIVEFDSELWKASLNPIRKAREQAGLSIKELTNLIGAPYRTVQDWNSGVRKPPEWLQKIIVEKIQSAI